MRARHRPASTGAASVSPHSANPALQWNIKRGMRGGLIGDFLVQSRQLSSGCVLVSLHPSGIRDQKPKFVERKKA
jgi:hypothetical protein